MQVGNKIKDFKTISDIWSVNAKRYPDIIALDDKYSNLKLTYSQAYECIKNFASGLQSLGVAKGNHIAQFSENCIKWMIADQAIFKIGAVNAVRGSQAPVDELAYILEHSDSEVLIADNINLLSNLKESIKNNGIKFVIFFVGDEKFKKEDFDIPVYSFEEVIEIGKNNEFVSVEINNNDLATIVYSSGTTGKPKGIMLTHGNLVSQIINVHSSLQAEPKHRSLNVLPIWHMYERTCEYYLLSVGCMLAYTNVRNFKKDIKKHKPHYLVSVPRLWESVYEGVISEISKKGSKASFIFSKALSSTIAMKKARRIYKDLCIENLNSSPMKKILCKLQDVALTPMQTAADKVLFSKIREALGGCLIKGISGGGALARHVEDFFEAINVEIHVGYGLTETSPVLTYRKPGNNKRYSAGQPLPETDILIVDTETLKPLKSTQKGLVLAKGPQIMPGYYKDQQATEKVLYKNGWFNTGDIGWLTPDNTLVLTGRLKDTIVLSNGENIEPECIEQACLTSSFVSQIVLVGQDKDSLGALITPNEEAIEKWATKNNLALKEAIRHPEFKNTLHKDIQSKVKSRPNFRPFERISNVHVLDEQFSIENGLMTRTAKIKKQEVFNRYKDLIDNMFR